LTFLSYWVRLPVVTNFAIAQRLNQDTGFTCIARKQYLENLIKLGQKGDAQAKWLKP